MEVWQRLRDSEGDPSAIRAKFRVCFLAQPPVVFSSRSPKKDHYNLSYAFLTRAILESPEMTFQCKTWVECLPKPTITLLHENVVQRGLTNIDKLACYVKVIASVRSVGLGRINCAMVHHLLEGLREELHDNPAFRRSMEHVLQEMYKQTRAILVEFHADFYQPDDFEALDLQAALWCRGYLAGFCTPRDDICAKGSRVKASLMS